MIYHRDVYWPKRIRDELPTGQWKLKYSVHALRASNDRYGKIPKLVNLTLIPGNFIESYYTGESPFKWTYRIRLSDELDLSLVFSFESIIKNECLVGSQILVITQWLNKSDDTHGTLRKENYVQNSTRRFG